MADWLSCTIRRDLCRVGSVLIAASIVVMTPGIFSPCSGSKIPGNQ